MADMNKPETKGRLSEEEVDRLVESEAEDLTAWEPPIHVHPPQTAAVTLTGDLARRAAFLARLHHERSLTAWLLRIIRERVELEEGAFVEAKRELGLKGYTS